MLFHMLTPPTLRFAARGANTLPGSFAASLKALLELRDIANRLASVIVKHQMWVIIARCAIAAFVVNSEGGKFADVSC